MAEGQVAVMQTGTGQVQLVQVNPTSQVQQVIQGANGQQIVVHTVPQATNQIQVTPTSGQIQVVPVQSLQVRRVPLILGAVFFLNPEFFC